MEGFQYKDEEELSSFSSLKREKGLATFYQEQYSLSFHQSSNKENQYPLNTPYELLSCHQAHPKNAKANQNGPKVSKSQASVGNSQCDSILKRNPSKNGGKYAINKIKEEPQSQKRSFRLSQKSIKKFNDQTPIKNVTQGKNRMPRVSRKERDSLKEVNVQNYLFCEEKADVGHKKPPLEQESQVATMKIKKGPSFRGSYKTASLQTNPSSQPKQTSFEDFQFKFNQMVGFHLSNETPFSKKTSHYLFPLINQRESTSYGNESREVKASSLRKSNPSKSNLGRQRTKFDDVYFQSSKICDRNFAC